MIKNKAKNILLSLWSVEKQIRAHIKVSRFLRFKVPFIGKFLSMFLDRLLFILFGVDLLSESINVKQLSISHPSGVLLGGNGIISSGRVVVMSGVKSGGRSPDDEVYLLKQKTRSVFELGDNVVIGSNSVVLGPISICDNVIIGSMSLVNKSIEEPGIYVGVPVKKIAAEASESWVAHL